MGMNRETMLVSELRAMQIDRIVLLLSLLCSTTLVTGQDRATENVNDSDGNAATAQTGDTPADSETTTRFTPKEIISPDSIISFPADI